MRSSGRLTVPKVAKLVQPGRYGDGGNLWLQITDTGRTNNDGKRVVSKSWLFRYQFNGGKSRQMGLGPVALVSLAEARELALAARKELLKGVDPIEARKAARAAVVLAEARGITFEQAAERYVSAHEGGWRNAKHRAQWRATLTTYGYPILGHLSVASVDTALVLKVLEQECSARRGRPDSKGSLWASRPETASRLRGRIEAVLDWAAARNYRQGENPARWRGHLAKILPARGKVRRVRHQPAMAYADAPAFVAELRRLPFVSARALEFTILTAARTGEVIGASWPEIDLVSRVWTVPEQRTKTGRKHRVPLSDRALQILQEAPGEEGEPAGFLFVGARKGKPLSNMAMLELLRGMRGKGPTVHGFRSAFRDWAAERTNYPREVAEAALAHMVGDKVEAAYRRGDLFEKRRRLMRDWAKFCTGRQELSA